MEEWEPIDWVEFDDAFLDNEERAERIVRKYGFDFAKIAKQEIRDLIEQEIENFHEGSSEYIRVLCGYLYCVGDSTDVALIKRAKYDISMDVGCMIDGEWIDSLESNDANGQRESLIKSFVRYYHNYLEE